MYSKIPTLKIIPFYLNNLPQQIFYCNLFPIQPYFYEVKVLLSAYLQLGSWQSSYLFSQYYY